MNRLCAPTVSASARTDSLPSRKAAARGAVPPPGWRTAHLECSGMLVAEECRMKMTIRNAVAALSLFVVVACGGANTRDLGNLAIGTRSVHVTLESAFGDGVVSKYAIQPTTGTAKPDSVQCWWGAQSDSSTRVTASYDAKDLDFDCLVLTKHPADGKLFIELTYGSMSESGSIAVPAT